MPASKNGFNRPPSKTTLKTAIESEDLLEFATHAVTRPRLNPFSAKLPFINVLTTSNNEDIYIGDQIGEGGFSKVRLIASHQDNALRFDALKLVSISRPNVAGAKKSAKEVARNLLHEVTMMQTAKSELGPLDVFALHSDESISAFALRLPLMRASLDELVLGIPTDDFAGRQMIANNVYKQLAPALSEMHTTYGVALRDIKPGNILVSSAGKLLFSDFGLATTDCFVADGAGSGSYLAPESALYRVKKVYIPDGCRRAFYSPFEADLWQFGVTLAQTISASTPFRLGRTDDKNYKYATLIAQHSFLRDHAEAWAAWPKTRKLVTSLQEGHVIEPAHWLAGPINAVPQGSTTLDAIFQLLRHDATKRKLLPLAIEKHTESHLTEELRAIVRGVKNPIAQAQVNFLGSA